MESTEAYGAGGLRIPRLTLGTWAFAGGAVWGEQDERESAAVVHAALEQGLVAFDSAPGYGEGRAEAVLGAALRGRRERAFVATKVSGGQLAAEGVRKSCEASLKRLGTDWIDLLQVHWPNHSVPVEETVAAFHELKTSGKVRHIGVCNFGVPELEGWRAAGGEAATNQVAYSLLSRAIEWEILPYCGERGIGILAYSPLMQGLLTGKFADAGAVPESRARTRHFRGDRPGCRHGEAGCEAETFAAIRRIGEIARREGIPMGRLALSWILSGKAVSSVIVGARTVEQLEENRRALEIRLSEAVLKELREATEAVRQSLGPNPDLWESPGRIGYGRGGDA